MDNRQKLELTWIGKENRPRLEPRILLEEPEKSYHAKHRVSGKDIFDNRLIFGDNLLALKALESEFTGKVKCVFIDPPYNTGSAFTHYDDGLEHSIWLSLMRDRLEIIRRLLSDDGSLWITIDDNEAHYLKVMCDEIFGRGCFVTSFIWKKVDSPNDNKVAVTPDHEYVLCFSKTPGARWFKQRRDDAILAAYRSPDVESDYPYRDRLLKKNGKNSLRSDRPSMFFPVIAPDGSEVLPIHDDGREARWALGKKAVDDLIAKKQLIWKQRRSDNGTLRWVPYTREFAPADPARPHPSIWSDLHTTRQTKAHQKIIFGEEDTFDTPKPENLVHRALDIATNPGDITKSMNWKGGGGFRYYRLAPSLLEKDKWGNWVINKTYNAAMLAEALCKLEGFTYAPSDSVYWQHGHSTERDFIYVTTANLNHEQLQQLSDEVGPERSLLVLCTAFRGRGDYPSLTVKKIPRQVLSRCEWGHDDYSLQVENLPKAPPKPGQQSLFDEEEP